MAVSDTSPDIAAQNDKAQGEALLREVRASLTGFELAHAPAALERLAALRLTPAQALELQAFQILVRSLGEQARPDDLLMHAKRLQVQAQAENHPMLQVARRHQLHYHEGLALLNLAVVKATLGQPGDCRDYLAQFRRSWGDGGVQPYWRLGLRLCDVLLLCVEGARSDAWQALLAFDAELALEPPHSAGAREIVAYAIRHYGRQWGYLEETLQACLRQVQVERRHKRELATALGDTINAVMERPQLLHQNAQLARHGTALEHSLVQRNAELGEALARLQREMTVREAAEAALRRTHDELEHQVRERTAALEQAMRSLSSHPEQEPLCRFDLCELLRASATGWQPQLAAQGVTLAFTLPPHLWMSGYPGACGLIFQQLLDNSLSHGFRGGSGGAIAIEAAMRDGAVLIRWRDNGCGIAAEHLPKVFEPFFTTQLGGSGAGLGLASVHSLAVDLMQGTVDIASTPGAGTEVVLRLPMDGMRAAAPQDA